MERGEWKRRIGRKNCIGKVDGRKEEKKESNRSIMSGKDGTGRGTVACFLRAYREGERRERKRR